MIAKERNLTDYSLLKDEQMLLRLHSLIALICRKIVTVLV